MPAILIVDDDAAVRESLVLTLNALGYQPTAVSSGKDALPRLAGVDLLITDLLMAEQDGLELIQAALLVAPKIKIIAVSGGGRGAPGTYLRIARHFGAHATLEKPFSRDELAFTIKSLFSA